MAVAINGAVAAKVGFASHQNAVPILRELEIVNGDDAAYEHVTLELVADPPFLEAKTWNIDALAAGSTLHINDRDVRLNAGFLLALDESIVGAVTLRLIRSGETVVARDFPVELLARAHWGGARTMAELLAAFVMPNDSAVDRVLKGASDVLRRAGKKDAIDGYEGGTRGRVWELASAIWSSITGFRISYALPPASFELEGQKVRTPSAILEGRMATCLDTALLFAAALEQAGLNALLVLVKGHAFVGVWLQPQEFAQLITEDAAAIRKRLDLQELLVFETTLATQAPPPGFGQAIAVAARQVAEDRDADFMFVLDLKRARMQRIRPLAAGSDAAAAGEEAQIQDGFEEAPALPGFDVELPAEAAGPGGRLELWQRKLLDLTTRNRLLHLPDGSKSVRLFCPDAAALENRLAEGKRVRIVPLPDLDVGGRDAALYERRTQEDLQAALAQAALERGEVLSALEKARLDTVLVDLYRKARSDLDEGGANTLFLALGFLKWRKSAADPKQYRAPLILLPVKLERKSALSGVTLVQHEDEPRFNLTLLELLRQDFDLVIPGLDGALPGDESGIDVVGVWNVVRRAVRDIPGFEVATDLVLGTFSFAKYLMWKDLADRADQLAESPVVRHLIERTDNRFESRGTFVRPDELDRKVDPASLFLPLPADSSQIAAVVASASGCDFVLDGPPGTGKSQTIANMIAHNLALGRRVLFVAEKMAALDVVHRRLREKGLGEFCLELHSNKTAKIDVLKQLERAWEARDALSAEEWAREAAAVKRLCESLNAVVDALHRRWPNGLTLHRAIGRTIRDANALTPKLAWASPSVHDEAALDNLRDAARRLDLNGPVLGDAPLPLRSILRKEWSNGWQEAVCTAAQALIEAVGAFGPARDDLVAAAQLPIAGETDEQWARLEELARRMLGVHGLGMGFAFSPDAATRIAAARRAAEILAAYRREEAGLSAAYAPEACRRVDLAALDAAWAAAGRKFWFFASLAKKKVARELAAQGGAAARPDPGGDLPKLRRALALLGELDGLAPTLGGLPGWSALASDVPAMQAACEHAEALRAAIGAAVSSPQELVALRRAVASLVVDANELLAPGGGVSRAAARFADAFGRYREAATLFVELAAVAAPSRGAPNALRAVAQAVLDHRLRLKAWCDWQHARAAALALDLGPLVDAAEAGNLPEGGARAAFETAYARWFAAAGIDAEPRLRGFVVAEHMNDIEAYRRLEDRLSALSVRYIRATLCGAIPAKDEVGRKGGYGILKRELQKQRRHKSVRQLATEMGEAFTRLAPCMLMSPLSIAQYLPPDQALFDLVIFDEASQIAPWDAIGSIARGRQVVVAGDPRQMPPTSYFDRAAPADEDVEDDMESILDECLGAGIPSRSLTWHYRSRHESLIAFSNHRYYEGGLVTFPAAVTKATAVAWRRVAGVYAKGKGRTNQVEAEALAAEAVRRLTDPAFVGAGRSLGIVTLNAEQQMLVEDLLDKARAEHPEIEPFFGDDVIEPVVVKNLETVQGDERDLVLLGIGYGPTEPGAPVMSMNFGPLNRQGGWRRLNVALTRARHEMIVFTSFDPAMIDLNRTGARAVRDLKHFLEFADRGPSALAEAIQGSVGGHDSPFEEAVARELRRKGWTVVPQIGVSRFRIDLGIVHPERPGDYLAGVECDGAAYHSAATARDRDKIRQTILERLGWRLVRVWSSDWWVDMQSAVDRLDAQLRAILESSRATAASPSATAPQDR